MERYILKYLQEHADSELIKKFIDYLKVDLDGMFYAYGDNMNENYPLPRSMDWRFYTSLMKLLLKSRNTSNYKYKDINILSFVNLPAQACKESGFNFLSSIIQPVGDRMIYSKELIEFYVYYAKITRKKDFNDVVTKENAELLEHYKEKLLKEYSEYNFKALFVGNGEPFIFKLHLDLFKQLQVPSFIFLHGIPGIYNLDTERKADYLLVWGEQIRQNYINAGFDPNKVVVTGHPRYFEIPTDFKLRNNLSNVLVTTTASVSWSPHGWKADHFPIYDRSIIVLYCYSVQSVLQKMGVKHARLRVHPSVRKDWIMKFVDKKFYTIDTTSLQQSLHASSLVIGPTSTVWLESILAGVNYLVYEPELDGNENRLVPPFDGSDALMDVAFSEDSLYNMVKEKYMLDTKIVRKYIDPFEFKKVFEIIKSF